MQGYLPGIIKQFQYYKNLADKAMAQVADEQFHWQPDEASNSIATIVKHMAGNMRSRWTDFLRTDGEKPWRNREAEFTAEPTTDRAAILQDWEQGWECLFDALSPLTDTDLKRIIYIRNEGHTVLEAIHRQLAHYPYHVGQIVYLARMLAQDRWQSLSIPRGGSEAFNAERFGKDKERRHFTDSL
ncbi:MAG TPA: DUF1572 family protein [Saprospiraceae bacterium]|nr:DUF1572 family protein [Saprospiraceae bacterium]HMP26165.1 DUF1572 family protein [Saprospiraceae bacterium]